MSVIIQKAFDGAFTATWAFIKVIFETFVKTLIAIILALNLLIILWSFYVNPLPFLLRLSYFFISINIFNPILAAVSKQFDYWHSIDAIPFSKKFTEVSIAWKLPNITFLLLYCDNQQLVLIEYYCKHSSSYYYR